MFVTIEYFNFVDGHVHFTDLHCKMSSSEGRFDLEAYNKNSFGCGLSVPNLHFNFQDLKIVVASQIEYILEVLKYSDAYKVDIWFSHIKGLNVQSPIELPHTVWLNQVNLIFLYSALVFYDNRERQVETCDDFERLNSTRNYYFIYWNAINDYDIQGEVRFLKTKFNGPVCELFFKNTRIKKWQSLPFKKPF